MPKEIEYSLVTGKDEIKKCYAVMSQLRPHLSLPQFTDMVVKQQSQGYHLVKAFRQDLPKDVCGVAGFVIGNKLAWGKHVYIDDLVAESSCRSLGIGKGLLNWVISFGLEQGCASIHLDSGVQRFAAHKFYLRENFQIASHHFSKQLN